jgi:hypothetical protein
MTLKIYAASSWRNKRYPAVVAAMRTAGFDVYDFRKVNDGFHWSCTMLHEYIEQLQNDPQVAAAFERDHAALDQCAVCVLIEPCGKSACLEAMFASAAGKPVIVLFDAAEPFDPEKCELMLKLLAIGAGGVRYVSSTTEMLAALRAHEARGEFNVLVEQLARDEMEKAQRLIEAGHTDLLEKVHDGEIDMDTAMQIFDGQRPS